MTTPLLRRLTVSRRMEQARRCEERLLASALCQMPIPDDRAFVRGVGSSFLQNAEKFPVLAAQNELRASLKAAARRRDIYASLSLLPWDDPESREAFEKGKTIAQCDYERVFRKFSLVNNLSIQRQHSFADWYDVWS